MIPQVFAERRTIRFIVLVLLAVCASCESPASPGSPGVTLLSEATLSDTIPARLEAPVVVEERRADGALAAGVPVSFAIEYSPAFAIQGLAASPWGRSKTR